MSYINVALFQLKLLQHELGCKQGLLVAKKVGLEVSVASPSLSAFTRHNLNYFNHMIIIIQQNVIITVSESGSYTCFSLVFSKQVFSILLHDKYILSLQVEMPKCKKTSKYSRAAKDDDIPCKINSKHLSKREFRYLKWLSCYIIKKLLVIDVFIYGCRFGSCYC